MRCFTQKIVSCWAFKVFCAKANVVLLKFYLFKDLSIRFKDYWGKFKDFSRTWAKFSIFKDFSRPVRTMYTGPTFEKKINAVAIAHRKNHAQPKGEKTISCQNGKSFINIGGAGKLYKLKQRSWAMFFFFKSLNNRSQVTTQLLW